MVWHSRFLLPFMQCFEQKIGFFCVCTYQILALLGIGGEIIEFRVSCLEKLDQLPISLSLRSI